VALGEGPEAEVGDDGNILIMLPTVLLILVALSALQCRAMLIILAKRISDPKFPAVANTRSNSKGLP
jgi:hypothetical protein